MKIVGQISMRFANEDNILFGTALVLVMSDATTTVELRGIDFAAFREFVSALQEVKEVVPYN